MERIHRIRQATPEQLATFIISMDVKDSNDVLKFCKDKEECTEKLEAGGCIERIDCIRCLAEWLQEEDDGNILERI